MMARDDVQTLLQDPTLDPTLRKRLELSQQVRTFATEVMLLPDNHSYRDYVALDRDYVVWNVVATPEFSITPTQHCFLVVGCLSYRGYYSRVSAETYATILKQQGLDVMVGGSQAYSTLGWFSDPLLSSFVLGDESRMIEIIFHELAHQLLYIDDDTAFNEAFATLVAQEGMRRWYQSQQSPQQWQKYTQRQQRRQQFNELLLKTRAELTGIYNTAERQTNLQQQKRDAFARLQSRYQQFKRSWNDYNGYDKWMQQGLNNAHIALTATYHQWVEGFKTLLTESEGDLQLFYKRAAQLGQQTAAERASKLSPQPAKAG